MSENDQADGFFSEDREWGKCSHLECHGHEECLYPLGPNENSGRGKTFEKIHDVARQTQYALHYRLSRGFAILSGEKHDL